jgi:type IV secretory pathway VirD2 relaxase
MAGTGAAKLKDHLSYLERDATQKDASPGKLYGSLIHDVDTESFRDRCKGDRHHFRFVVSPEDAGQLADVRAYTRDLVSRMESDLGTKLDWVAIDHYDTAQPHTHLLVRGVRDDGKDLVIPRQYMSHGMRERAQEIASLELGPQSELEKRAKLARTIDAQHKTDLDKMIDRAREGETLDMRKPVSTRQLWRRQLMARRIKTLQRMGLADYEGRGRWCVKPDFTNTLTKMGEQNDIIKTLHRAFGERSAELRLGGQPLYAKVAEDDLFSSLNVGQAVTVQAFDPEPIQADRNIVAHAKNRNGQFSFVHVYLEENNSEEYTRAHERRLEALGRAGVVSKNKSGAWDIPDDYLDRVRE